MTENDGTREYAPDYPSGIGFLAWLSLVAIAIGFGFLTYFTITAKPDHVMFTHALGGDFKFGTGLHRLLGFLIGLLELGIGAWIVLSVLRARMWAYYLFLAGAGWGVASIILDVVQHRSVPILNWVVEPAVLLILLLGYRQYKVVARYRRRHPRSPEPVCDSCT